MTIDIVKDEDIFLIALDEKSKETDVRSAIKDMIYFCQNLVVCDEDSFNRVTSIYRCARDWKKAIEEKRKKLIDPYRKKTMEINDLAKSLSSPLDDVIDLANFKSNSYQRMLESLKKEEEKILKEAASIFDAEEDVYVTPLEKVIRGNGAVSVTTKESRFRVLDLSKVPLKYLKINEESVKQDIKLGINEIPGIEIWEEQKTQLRIR